MLSPAATLRLRSCAKTKWIRRRPDIAVRIKPDIRLSGTKADIHKQPVDSEDFGAFQMASRGIETGKGAAYVVTCSPTAMRLHSGPLKAQLEAAAAILDKQGVIPKAPEILGEKSITELLADGTVKFTVDPKYPQALGIANILHHTSVFGNSPWEAGEEGTLLFIVVQPGKQPRTLF